MLKVLRRLAVLWVVALATSVACPAQDNSYDDNSNDADNLISQEDVEQGGAQKPAVVSAHDKYFNEPIPVKHFDKKEWEKVVDGERYIENEPKKIQKSKPGNFRLPNLGPAAGVLKILMILVCAGLLGFVLWALFKDVRWGRGAKVDINIEEIPNLDEELPEVAALRKLLQAALAKGDYKLAVRYYYLMVIAQYREQGFIVWKKDKTNRQYLFELREHNRITDIKTATRLFENYWYGDMQPDANRFAEAEHLFKSLLGTT